MGPISSLALLAESRISGAENEPRALPQTRSSSVPCEAGENRRGPECRSVARRVRTGARTGAVRSAVAGRPGAPPCSALHTQQQHQHLIIFVLLLYSRKESRAAGLRICLPTPRHQPHRRRAFTVHAPPAGLWCVQPEAPGQGPGPGPAAGVSKLSRSRQRHRAAPAPLLAWASSRSEQGPLVLLRSEWRRDRHCSAGAAQLRRREEGPRCYRTVHSRCAATPACTPVFSMPVLKASTLKTG